MFSSDSNRRRAKCGPVRAFQTDPSWYEAYWYAKPAPQRPSSFNSRAARLIGMSQRLRASLGKFAEILHSGPAWASRSFRRLTEQRR
jgi:hypothetical protein